MREFEKWWNSGSNEELNKLCSEDAPRQDWTEAGYRRALRWLGREIVSLDDNGTIRSLINSELES